VVVSCIIDKADDEDDDDTIS